MTHTPSRAAQWLGFTLLLGLVGCAAGPTAPAPRFRAISVQPGDSITIDDATGDVTIDITSERGIGKAEIQRSGAPPKTLTINLHLKGLEELRYSWADAVLLVHVASGDASVREEVSLAGGPANAIDNTSPYWAPVRILGQDPTIPLDDGYFAVTAPPAYLQAAPHQFALQWIDFYR